MSSAEPPLPTVSAMVFKASFADVVLFLTGANGDMFTSAKLELELRAAMDIGSAVTVAESLVARKVACEGGIADCRLSPKLVEIGMKCERHVHPSSGRCDCVPVTSIAETKPRS
jgi:hypothetical protein